jgi:2-C-methyl-D-erythritol 4-phosphate cytidylyltransferase/2-C-methyl-D-erythritol 2,4-cyclodiphosphate synthase
MPLNGRPILAQSMMAFLGHPNVDAVKVVIAQGHQALYKQAINSLSSPKLLPPVIGGAERCESVRLGLESLVDLSPRHVLIHDGARPFVTLSLIHRVIQALGNFKGVIPGIAVVDTLKRTANDHIEVTVERQGLTRIQTPQGFDFQTILSAHQTFANTHNPTDDASLLERLNIPVRLVAGDPKNKKITTSEDMQDMTAPIPDIRVGHGIDVHAIGPGAGVILLGVWVPAPFSLIGHSDADVGLHSLTDALLGAIGDGDIGQHFNPKDDRWKGADSALFLQDAARRVRGNGGHIAHVDVTLLGERPKIAPYRPQMTAKVAEILDIAASRVSIKATTTEKLGFIGREEGLGAFATATVVF